jgi:hypothetical protein
MNLAEPAVESLAAIVPRATGVSDCVARYRWLVYSACVLLALACNYVLGKDMAWDTTNYHLYLGYSALNDRFVNDYFAAGVLSYFNPYAYVPFYAMVRAGLPALAICSIFAAFHSIILWLTFELGVAVCPSKDHRTRILAGICAAILALMNPILMQEIGSCFADITTAELALGGWLLLAGAVREPRISRVVWGGLLLGVATGLKLSNSVPAVSAFAMLIMLPLDFKGKAHYALAFGLALGVGFILVAAPWSYRLEQIFGNPMFPMFNDFFKSPEFLTDPMVHYRFVPQSIGDALWRPFAMLNPTHMVHEELSAPDPRYAVLVVLGTIIMVHWLSTRLRRPSSEQVNPPLRDHTRILFALGLGLGVQWNLWLKSSGNSRYVLAMACIAAAVIIGMLFQFFESRPKVRNYILMVILGTQAVQLSMGAEYRWNAASWGGPWFDISMPEKLKSERNLYLTLGVQSNSFLAPYLSRDSGFVNFAGGFTLDPDGVNGSRVKALIKRYSPNVRVVFGGGERYKNASIQAPSAPEVDDSLSRYGLRTDMSDCATITIHGLPPALEIRYETSQPLPPQNRDTTYLVACRVVPDNTDRSALATRQHQVDLVFDRLEDTCPQLFRPHRLVTVHEGDVWRRLYGSTDISAWISHGRLKMENLIRPNGITDLGPESDWLKAPVHLDCGIHDGVEFAHVAQPHG